MMTVYNRKAKWIQLAPWVAWPLPEFTTGGNELACMGYRLGMHDAAGSIHMSPDDRTLVMSGV